jgi:hypothetical protein
MVYRLVVSRSRFVAARQEKNGVEEEWRINCQIRVKPVIIRRSLDTERFRRPGRGGGIRTHGLFVPNETTWAFSFVGRVARPVNRWSGR